MSESALETVTDTSLFEFRDEVVVELTGLDGRDEFAVVSFEFARDPADRRSLTPREPVDDEHGTLVRDTLADAGYRVAQAAR